MKVKHERTADCVVAGFRVHKDGEGVGSLLLGLYDDDGRLHHVGVCAAFTAAFRRELVDELGPLTEDALDGHPWRGWAEAQADSTQRMPGGFSRWNVNKDLSFVPLRVGTCGRGDVRPTRGRSVPARREVPALAVRSHAGVVPVRAARRRQPGAIRRTARRVGLSSRRALGRSAGGNGGRRRRGRRRRRGGERCGRRRLIDDLHLRRRGCRRPAACRRRCPRHRTPRTSRSRPAAFRSPC